MSNKNFFSSDFKLGILGGGQLGKMLLYHTRKYDIQTKVLDPSPDAPARLAADHFETGSLLDYDTVVAFGKDVDVLTIEIEAVNTDALKTLQKQGIKCFPQPEVLELIKNKARQKEFYSQNAIPTADFEVYSAFAKAQKSALKRPFPFIWKAATGGYDGMGVKVVRSEKDLHALPDTECILEDMIAFELELAVIVARNPSGNSVSYPVVEMEFHPEANQVEYVICPARISSEIAEKARALALQVSNAFEHIGLLAVEMFLTKEGELLVNEVAPRPHNSGHYSIEGAYTDQFEQHLRCVLDLPLGKTDSKVAAIMVNLVGAEGHTGNVKYKNIEQILAEPGVIPHIYGKKRTRPFRKMGHVTIIDEDMNVARKRAEKVKSTIQVISS